MEKSANDSTVVLSVNINCCNACSKKAKKLLLKVAGVLSVEVDREKNLVHVTGNADTKLLIKAISKMKRKAEVVANKTKSEDEKNANTDVEKGNKSEGSNIVEASYHVPPRTGFVEEFCAVKNENKSEGSNIVEASYDVPKRTGFVEEFCAVKNENKSEGPNINEGCYGPPRIQFGEEFCAYPYGRMHNMDYHQGYMQMPPIANYNCPPWMNLRQDECYHPSVMPQDYGVNYPYRPPGFYNYNNFF